MRTHLARPGSAHFTQSNAPKVVASPIIQASPAGSHDLAQVSVSAPARGPRPLPETLRARMETSFGADFSTVRVHEGPEARSIGARAFTRGEHLHFAPGKFRPETRAGQALIGHELTHVVQQRARRVARPGGGGLPVNAEPRLEAEADAFGARAARGEPARVGGPAPGAISQAPGAGAVQASAASAPIQCDDDEENPLGDHFGSRLGMYGGISGSLMAQRYYAHKYGGNMAKGFETGSLGALFNWKHVRNAPRPMKIATGAMITGGMLATAPLGITKSLYNWGKDKLGFKKK